MRITFDSNAWEAVFTIADTRWEPIRAALQYQWLEGFICAAGFRIETITKRTRSTYFAQPFVNVSFDVRPSTSTGCFTLIGSIGPNNPEHPGLPLIQAEKFRSALALGMKLMHGQNWMGLPVPHDVANPELYVVESSEEASERESRQVLVSMAINERGVGNAAFVAADGWTDRQRTPSEEKKFSRACAEWADGELVAAHIAYRNTFLCTSDRAGRAGRSIFDTPNRAWLAATYGVVCVTLEELAAKISLSA